MSPFIQKNLITSPISKKCFVCVVIPARDESEFLQKTLESFTNQIDLCDAALDADIFEIILLLNNCRDNSADVARAFQKEHKNINLHIREIELPLSDSNSGFVRRILMNEAFQRLTKNRENGGIIITTDGDTRVADDWIAANIYEIKTGADAVGGRILFSETELAAMNPAARRFHLIDEKYQLLVAELEAILDFQTHDAAPRHHQHFNGSFAATTEIYEKAGGVPEVSSMEDVAFFRALMRIDAKVRHSPLVKVFTSARNSGRTEAGLSTQINDWKILAEQGKDFFVESAEAVEKRLKNQNNLRRVQLAFQKNNAPNEVEIEKLAKDFCISFKDLFDEIKRPQIFGSLLENVLQMQSENKIWNDKYPFVPVNDAVGKLEKLLKKLRSNGKVKSVSI